jgi:hypothetical protein
MKWFETTGFYGTQSKHLFNKKLKAISLMTKMLGQDNFHSLHQLLLDSF